MSNKVVNIKNGQSYDVYIGRGSIFGNPFSHLPLQLTKASVKCGTREESVQLYKEWIVGKRKVEGLSPPDIKLICSLKGKTLGCYCAPKPCHGHILAEIADSGKEYEM